MGAPQVNGLVLWVGPVSASMLAGHVPDGWSLQTINHGPSGSIHSSDFRSWALSLGPDPLGRIAPNFDAVIVASFSAGHGASDVILERCAALGDDRLSGYLGADSYYLDSLASPPKPGHLAFGACAAHDGRPFWLTTSTHPNQARPSASACVASLSDALRLRRMRVPPSMPPGASAHGRGGALWLDYGATFAHPEHATVLAPMALDAWQRSSARAPSSLPLVLGALALAVKFWRRA